MVQEKVGDAKMAKVSIIIPVCNAEEYILNCLDSLRNQSFSDIRIICIENGSTDNSWNEVFSQKKDRRLIALKVPYADVSYSRNLGLFWALKSSPYVMFCDADDTYDKYMVELMVNGIEESHADFGCCEIAIDYQSDQELKKSDDDYYTLKYEGLNTNIKEIINNVDYSLCNKIFLSSIIKKYSINFPDNFHYEDACFCWKYMSVSESAFFIKKKLYHYLRRENSIMNRTFAKENRSIDHMKIAKNVHAFLVRQGLMEKFREEFREFYDACVTFTKKYVNEKDMPGIEWFDSQLREYFFR